MALYNYSRYTVGVGYVEPPSWADNGNQSHSWLPGYWSSYTFDSKTGQFSPAGREYREGDTVYNGTALYYPYYSSITRHTVTSYAPGEAIQMSWSRNIYTKRDKKDNPQQGDAQGSFLTNVVAENGTYPTNGKHSDGYWYVRGSAYVPPNYAPSTPQITSITGEFSTGKNITVNWSVSTDPEGKSVSYYLEQRLYKNGVAQSWSNIATIVGRSHDVKIPEDNTITKIEFRVRSFEGVNYSSWSTITGGDVSSNKAPTLVLNTADNRTLYENDTFVIDGQASDTDNGNIVNVKYSINGGTARAIMVDISDGTKSMSFNRQLTFKGGKLYEGESAITGALSEGTAHQLKVWAEDDKGGKSAEQIRTFYVVPNRPPSLTIDPFESLSDLIDVDKVTFSGESFDLDGNNVIVRYRINNGINTEIHNGPPGRWSFDFPLSKLNNDVNTIVVEVTDTYDFKFSKTIKLNKTANLTPLSKSVQRYKIVSPTGSAQGVLLWIQREETQEVTVEISMTNGTEQESYSAMTLSNTAPVSLGIVEDQFQFQADSAKENINVKIDISGTGAVTLILGVLS